MSISPGQTLATTPRRLSAYMSSTALATTTTSSFVFFAKATGRTVRQIWTNEGSKRVIPEVPFGGLNDVRPNSGG